MDSTYVSQRQIVERYVQGTLSPEELEAFEIYMLEHPEAVDDVEYEKGLQDAVAGAKEMLQPSIPAAGRSASALWLGPRYALAATVLLTIAAVSNLSQWRASTRLANEIELLKAPTVVSYEIRLERMRGAAPPLPVEQLPGDRLLLTIEVDADTRGPYSVSLRSADGAFSWNQPNVEPGADGVLRISAGNLDFGRYELTLVSGDPSRVANYTFELRPAP